MRLLVDSSIRELLTVFLKKFGLPSLLISSIATCVLILSSTVKSHASDFNHPWRDKQKALVIDAYEKNPINWTKMVTDKRIRAFIGKSSDGLPSPYSCSGNATKKQICKKSFQNYFMKQQLYHTRKALAKALGLKWGAYHLGRPGNPVKQANHFINFTKPEKDDLLALDLEHDDAKKWISFKDAEIFAKQVYKRIGRYPVLYTNHSTAKRIAARRAEFPLLSRLPLWYARFKGDVRGSFPMGNWDKYTLWQFSAHPNCNNSRCLYRVPGTENNIDVNVSTLSIAEFDKAWPFNGLVPLKDKKPEQFLVDNKTDKPEINIAVKEVITASAFPSSPASDKIFEHLNPDENFQVASINLDDIAVPTPRINEVPIIQQVAIVQEEVVSQEPVVVAALETPDVINDAGEFPTILNAVIPTKAVRDIDPAIESVAIAAIIPTAVTTEIPSADKPTIEVVIKPVEIDVVEVPVEAPVEVAAVEAPVIIDETVSEPASYGITTTDFEQEYNVVIPKSGQSEDLTMQLQYLSGAL